jgi:peptide/nickel transport system ATP-binding protein/oligopeptide transport system ATP-binding protein
VTGIPAPGERGLVVPAAPGERFVQVEDLRTYFDVMDGTVKAVDGVSFGVPRGGTIGLVGESGCGKSVTALTVMRLLEMPPARIPSGRVIVDGRDVLNLSDDQMRRVRGGEIAMIFQEPMTSLNPVFTIGDQISEAVLEHLKVSKKEAHERAVAALGQVGMSSPERRVRQYPHELSGGMRQRAMIAMGLSCRPKMLIADEPTTALDVTVQAQILDLIRDVQAELGMALMLITHDLGVVAEMVDEVAVMYAGRIVEAGPVGDVFLSPRHPYTQGLLESMPSLAHRGQRLSVIEGSVPNPFNMPAGCNFAPRCPRRFGPCREHDPLLGQVERIAPGDGRAEAAERPEAARDSQSLVACWLWQEPPAPGAPATPEIVMPADAPAAIGGVT